MSRSFALMTDMARRTRAACVGGVLAASLLMPVGAFGQATGTGAQPNYPGIAPSQGKVETDIGAFKVRFYGTVLLNTSVSDAAVFGQDIPLWTLPSTGTVTYPDGTVG